MEERREKENVDGKVRGLKEGWREGEIGEKGLFKGPLGSNVAFIGLLSAKHWSRALR